MKLVSTCLELIRFIPDGSRVFVHGAAATPTTLLQSICENSNHWTSLEFMHLHIHGEAPHKKIPHFRITNLFVGANLRADLDYERIDYLPCFLSEIPNLFRQGIRAPHVAIIQVSPPDQSGFCTLGTSVDVTRAAVQTAEIVLAQINPNMPRTHGDAFISVNDIDVAVELNEPLTESTPSRNSQTELQIGKFVSELIEDGATLQMGIGSIPDAVLRSLANHRDLGVHTEMFSDGLIPLIESGVVNNSKKSVHPGKTVAGFVMGSRKLYDFVHDNPSVALLESDYVNNTQVIRRNNKMVAINSAVEVDLTGQVVADSLGSKIISGVGGQMDFIRGATLSAGGKAIIALPSQTKKGQSRIAATLQKGAGVVTTRAHTRFVVTEHGIADLYGRTLHERAHALIRIAAPEHRDQLLWNWKTEHSNESKLK